VLRCRDAAKHDLAVSAADADAFVTNHAAMISNEIGAT
jgi:hypothetical protein